MIQPLEQLVRLYKLPSSMEQSRPHLLNETEINPSTMESITEEPKVSPKNELEETLVDRHSETIIRPAPGISYKKYKWGIGVSTCCLVTFLVMGIAGPFMIGSIIDSSINKQTVLGRDNVGVWASIPGNSETDFVRQFSFFNFSNWEDFVLHGSKPQFIEIQGYKMSQKQDYVDLEWRENDEVVKINSWNRFIEKPAPSRSLDEKVLILNPGPLGFWNGIKNADPWMVLNQGMGLSFVNVEALIKNTVMGMAISTQFLPDFETAWATLYESADIDRENAIFIWTDAAYGMNDSNTLGAWIVASDEGVYSKEAQDLGNYFTLSSSQLSSLMMSFKTFKEAANELVMSNYYCFGSPSCTDFDLAIKQYASSGVTANTPPVKGVEAFPSICSLNYSCQNYYAELGAFYLYEFLPNYTDTKYKNLTFDEKMVAKWFYHHGEEPNRNETFLLHLGNLKALYLNGTMFDRNVSDERPLQNIRQRFGLPTIQHAFVFWNWIKYSYNQFINRKDIGGGTDYTASALYGTESLYKAWAITYGRLHTLLLKYKIREMVAGKSCQQFISDSMRVDEEKIAAVCSQYNIRSLESIEKLILSCRFKYHDEWLNLMKLVNSDLAMEEFCDRTDEDGFGGMYEKAEIYLDEYYQCDQTPLPYCSDYEIAVKQWASSNITTNPIPEMRGDFKHTTTLADWFDDIRPFEYGHWVTKFPNETLPTISAPEAYKLMNHESLWSLNTWQFIWLEKNPQVLIDKYGIYHQEVMARYIRYVIIYVTFDGFVKERKVRDVLFGYIDELVDSLKTRDPIVGGDPSKPSLIHLNDLNITREQASQYPMEFHTGKNHHDRTAYIKTINGLGTINFNTSEWNGNETRIFVTSPWKEDIPIIGSDGKLSAPIQKTAPFNISIFVPAVQKTIYGNYTGESTEKFGIHINKFQISSSFFQSTQQNPANDKYYQELPGFINLTSLYQFPIFASKNHFYGADANWTNLIDIWNQNHTFKYQPSKWDDSSLYIEPYSGSTFSANIILMSSYYYKPDILFKTEGARMLPLFTIINSANLTEQGANKLFGALKTGLGAKKAIFWVGIVISILMLVAIVALVILYRKKVTYEKKKESLIQVDEEHVMV